MPIRFHYMLCVIVSGAILLTALPDSVAAPGGKTIVDEQCVSCHNISGPAADTFDTLLDRRAPNLFYAGSKFNRPWLINWLQNPTSIRRTGTVYLNHISAQDGKDRIAVDTIESCPAKLDRGSAEMVADYLFTLTDSTMKTGIVDPGKKFKKHKALRLFRKQLPCIGCHTIRWGKRVLGGVSGPSLTNAGTRLNPDWIYARIENPQHWDQKTWMPRLEMSHNKRELLTLFIASMKAPDEINEGDLDFMSPGEATPLTGFVAPKGSHGEAAEKRYRLYCVQCHGSQGNGRGVNDSAGGLSVSPRSHISTQEMAKLSDEEIKLAITKGGDAVQKSGLMPPWGNTFTGMEIDELVVYLRRLCECEEKQ